MTEYYPIDSSLYLRPTELNPTPFSTIDPSDTATKLLNSTGDDLLDRIREITFSSLSNAELDPVFSGAIRALHLLFTLGKAQYIRNVFGLEEDWIRSLDIESQEFSAKTLQDIIQDNPAYERLFREYLDRYSTKSFFRSDLIGLCDLEDIKPVSARPVARLLMLILVSTR